MLCEKTAADSFGKLANCASVLQHLHEVLPTIVMLKQHNILCNRPNTSPMTAVLQTTL